MEYQQSHENVWNVRISQHLQPIYRRLGHQQCNRYELYVLECHRLRPGPRGVEHQQCDKYEFHVLRCQFLQPVHWGVEHQQYYIYGLDV